MKRFVIATTIVGTLVSGASPALAQGMGHGGRHKQTQKNDTPATKANDKDYKAALGRLPTPPQKYDPWGTMRPANDKP
ncbi:MAG TPA: hypothetical protein VGG01_06075 [Xanthobacteraceae bacterium]|jgi:hypothetical protein